MVSGLYQTGHLQINAYEGGGNAEASVNPALNG